MSFIDKLMFWKKEPDFGGDLDLGAEGSPFGGQGFGADNLGQQSTFQPQGLPPQPGAMPQGPQPGLGEPQPGFQAPPSFSQPVFQQVRETQPSPGFHPSSMEEKNLEIVSSKIDALSAQLESISQRLKTIERVALEEEKKSHERSW